MAGPGSKALLRRHALDARDAIPSETRARLSQAIAARALTVCAAIRPRVAAGYVPVRSEVDPGPLLDRLRAGGAAIVLPAVVDGSALVFRRHLPETALVGSGFGTVAPPAEAPAADPELVVVPLVAFDRSGWRLGYGKGHYDRAVAGLVARGLRPLLVGLAFAVQEVAAIPPEAHDIRLDWVVTEDETLDLRTGGR